jgi:hypothetical protein
MAINAAIASGELEEGTVVSVLADAVEVSVPERPRPSRKSRQSAARWPAAQTDTKVELVDVPGDPRRLHVGDQVRVRRLRGHPWLSAFVLFGVPIVVLVATGWLLEAIPSIRTGSPVSHALAMLGLSLGIYAGTALQHRIRRHWPPRVLEEAVAVEKPR